jgi:single-stranded DNA-binding protein
MQGNAGFDNGIFELFSCCINFLGPYCPRKEISEKYRSRPMEMEKIANVNEVQIIGKVVKNPERQIAANGAVFLRVAVETERFVVMADKSKKRIAQVHTVVIRRQASVKLFEASARPGVTIRVVGELNYDPKPEIVVWEHIGQATLMSIPHTPVATQAASAPAAATPQAQNKPANTPAASQLREPPKSSGGPSKMSIGNKQNLQPTEQDVHFDDDDGDDSSPGTEIFNSPVFQQSADLSDDIPF